MKTQRGRTRKLRFSSVTDAAAVAAKSEHAPIRPVKRRKRQNRTRHVSPAPAGTATASGLPAATWDNIQERFAAAKSLGEITRTVLDFFKEHEDRQGAASAPAFPIFIPASEIYKLKVPRKRRIYDVLHVLEGIGVIKRVRYDETRNTKGGFFLYYGKAAVVERLADMKNNSAQVMASFRQARGSKVISVVEEDSALVKVFEDQAVVERWPCLGTTTVCFLALLFQEDYQVGVALPGMSDRIVDAKKFIGTTVPKSSWNEASQNAVQRRVYDVVSVLVSCNLILTSATPTLSLESSLDIADKNYQRKHVRFNYDIFTNPRSLFATCDDEIPPWNFKTSPNVLFCNRRETFCECQSPIVKSIQDRLATPPWQIVHTGMAHNSFFSPGAVQVTDTRRREKTNGVPSPFGGYERVATKCFAFSNSLLRSSAKCPQSVQQASRAHEFFSPIGREPLETNEWCDESLKQLGLFEALPTEDKIDWKLNEQFKDNYRELWGSPAALHPPVQNPAQQFWVDTVEVKVADIECHDVLNDNPTTPISNFFI